MPHCGVVDIFKASRSSVKYSQLFLLLQSSAKASRAENVQENVVYETQLQADHTLALAGAGGLMSHRQRGLHVSISDRTGRQRSLLLLSRGGNATKGELCPVYSPHMSISG